MEDRGQASPPSSTSNTKGRPWAAEVETTAEDIKFLGKFQGAPGWEGRGGVFAFCSPFKIVRLATEIVKQALRISREGVFQHPRDVSPIDRSLKTHGVYNARTNTVSGLDELTDAPNAQALGKSKEASMTDKRVPKIRFLAFLSLFSAVLTLLITQTAQTQTKTASHSHTVPVRSTLPNTNSSSLITPIFLPPVTYAIDGILQNLAVVDVNGDGKPDLLVTSRANDNTSLISVFLGNGDGSFLGPNASYSTAGQAATSALVKDVNGDGKPDVVVAESCASWLGNCADGDTLVAILLSNGDGTFQPAIVYRTGGYAFAPSVAVADVNGDGKPDLIIADWRCGSTGFDGCVSVLLGNGAGTFQTAQVYGSGGSDAEEIVVADVNGDGKLDLIVTNGGGSPSTVGVLLGNGDGTFQPAASYDSGGGFALGLMAPDLNHDKKPDLLVTNVYSDNTAVLLGNGDGTFRSAVAYPSGGQGIVATVLRDVNGDGLADLVLANCGAQYGFCPAPNGSVDVLLGNADGTFGPAYDVWGFPISPADLSVADLNQDGHPDLAVTTFFDGAVFVLSGNGDGTFQTGVSYASGIYRASLVKTADLNGDGSPDLVAGGADSFGHGMIGILLNNTPSCTTPPAIIVSATPISLWPPNGQMVPVTVSGTITDGGCTITNAVYAVTDEYGRVQPTGSVTLSEAGTYSFIIPLQASRLGTDLDGRLYTITVSASNSAGKTGSAANTVVVPHDKGH